MSVKINISCPVCNTIKEIEVPEYIFNQQKFKFVKIQVSEQICPHSFIVLLEPTKRKVVGYQKLDMVISFPAEEFETLKKALSLKTIIYLFGFYGVMCLLHARIYNYQVKILGKEFSDENLNLINDYFREIKGENDDSEFKISKISKKPITLNKN